MVAVAQLRETTRFVQPDSRSRKLAAERLFRSCTRRLILGVMEISPLVLPRVDARKVDLT